MSDRVSVRVGKAVRERLAATARASGRKESEIVRSALDAFLPNEPRQTTCLELARRARLIGRVKDMPEDLSTNKRHLEGFGS